MGRGYQLSGNTLIMIVEDGGIMGIDVLIPSFKQFGPDFVIVLESQCLIKLFYKWFNLFNLIVL